MSSFGSSQTTTNTGNTSGTFTPTQTQGVTDFRNSLYPQINSLLANASKPAYGQAEQAQFTNSLNKNTNAAQNSLASQLASRTGSVNSGAYASGIQNLQMGRIGAQAGYASSIPSANQNAYFQRMGGALGLGNSIAGPALTSNTQSGTSNSQQQVNYNPSIMSDIGQVAGVAGSVAGMAMGMPGMGGGTSQYMQALSAPNANSFGPGPSAYNPTPGFTQDASGYVQSMGGY